MWHHGPRQDGRGIYSHQSASISAEMRVEAGERRVKRSRKHRTGEHGGTGTAVQRCVPGGHGEWPTCNVRLNGGRRATGDGRGRRSASRARMGARDGTLKLSADNLNEAFTVGLVTYVGKPGPARPRVKSQAFLDPKTRTDASENRGGSGM